MRPDLWLLVLLGALGILFFFWKFQDSFPAASIDLRVNRGQATEISQGWAKKVGFNAVGAVESTVFNYDDDAKTFLEYELGQAKANVLMRTEIPVWSWVTRFCRPFQIEDLSVGLGPDGTLHYFSRSLPNDAAAPTIAHEQAKSMAVAWLKSQVSISVDGLTLIRDSQTKQVNRTDHYFVWEDQKRDYKEGRMRTFVYISGDKVTEYARFLHVPEKFQRKYAEVRSYNELLKRVSEIIFTILVSSITFVFIWALASGRLRWKLAAVAAVIAGVLSVLNWVDSIPTLLSGYPTTMSFHQFVTSKVVSAAVSTLSAVISCFVFIGALEPIYRMAFPEKVALEKVPTTDGLRSLSVFRSFVAGVAVFGIHTAYVVGFYLVGQHLGFWSPLEVRDTSVLSGLWPAFSAVDIGISAATMEELMYRVLAFVMFKRLTRNFWIANLLQAASWAFMHSDYPQEPAYARGVELTIGGFFYGYILRTYGLVACMLAHYTYDAFIDVTPLINSPDMGNRLSALLAVSPGPIGLAICGWLIWKRGLNKSEDVLTNDSIPTERKVSIKTPEPDRRFVYKPLSSHILIACVVAGLIGAAVMAGLPLRTVGKNNVLTISRSEAITTARNFLWKRGVITHLRSTAVLVDDSDDLQMQYVYEKSGFARTAQLAGVLEPRLLWKVRFFKPKDPQEFYVTLKPNGEVLYTSDIEEEDAPGASPKAQQARAMVEQFLAQFHPNLKPLVFENMTTSTRKRRTDYSFTYLVPPLKVAEADFQVVSGTVGGYVSGFSRGWQIPDAWKFDRNKVTMRDQALQILRIVFGVVVMIGAIWWVVGILRAGPIRWWLPIMLGGISAFLLALGQVNAIPTLFWSYRTEVTVPNFLTGTLVEDLIAVLSGAAATCLGAAIATSAYRVCFPSQPLASLFKAAWPHLGKVSAMTRRLWLDGVVIAVFYTLLVAGVDHLFDIGESFTSPSVHLFSVSTISSIGDEWSPALGALLSSLSTAIASVATIAVVVAFALRYFGNSKFKLFAFVLVADLIVNSGLRYWQDYVWTVSAYACLAVFGYLFIVRLARFNLVAYALAGYFAVLASTAYALVRHQTLQLYYPQLAVLLLAMAAPLVYTGWLYLAPRHELEVVPPDKVA